MSITESLPAEIYQAISIFLSLEDIWTLQQCSSTIEKAFDPWMLSRDDAVDRLICWACRIIEFVPFPDEGPIFPASATDNTPSNPRYIRCSARECRWAIDKALSHGADVSTIKRRLTVKFRLSEPKVVGSTLALAARMVHTEAFRLLLERGATLDIELGEWQSQWLRQFLLDLQHPESLQLCINRGMRHKGSFIQDSLDEALVSSYKDEGKGDLYYRWLDLGANPKSLAGIEPKSAISPNDDKVLGDTQP
ncbi:uncharacterized protein FTOL_03119 [Fusarium torulosum]|uniref:F-box domain-containing protein n=1 Tax=Fusarium torulosum TaxID=33205 RepID=A0AAE8M3A9_9HYPO|nr:uncharacterized protein FTOL_03119 [Fusarium torulosum]